MKRLFLFILPYIIFCSLSQIAHSQDRTDEKEYILLLNSANFAEPWSNAIYESLVEKVTDEGIEIKSDELLVPQMETMQDVQNRIDILLTKYPNPPRAIIFIGDPGWLTMRPLLDNQWKDIPTLLCYSRDSMPVRTEDLLSKNRDKNVFAPTKEVTKDYNLTVLRQPIFIKETIEHINKMMPNMEKVAFISDNRYISIQILEDVRNIVNQYFPNLKFESLSTPEMTTEELLNKLSEYNNKVGLIYYSWFVTDGKSKQSYMDDNIQQMLYGFTKTPIFSLSDRNMEKGDFAGGYYIMADDFVEECVKTIHKILNGTQAKDIEWQDGGKPVLFLNYHHLEHHNIPLDLFPEDAIYINSPPKFFTKYKFQLIIIAVILLLIIGITVIRMRWLVMRQKQLKRDNKLYSQYRRLVDNMPVIYYRRKKCNNGDFIFLDVNSAFEIAFGCKLEQVHNKHLSKLINTHKKLKVLTKNHDSDFFTIAGENGNRYYTSLTFDSSEADVQETFCIDRTEEYQAQRSTEEYNREREKLHEKYKLVLHATDLIPWTWNMKTETLECDFEYATSFGNLRNKQISISSKNYYDMIHPDDRERVMEAYRSLHDGHTNVLRQEYRTKMVPSGEKYHWARSYAVVKERADDFTPTMLVGASKQIDEQKELEKNLSDAKEANILKTAFIANMSHEIRTPLNAIVGFSSVLANTDDSDEKAEYVKLIESNNILLLQLINDILDLSTIEAGMMEFSAIDMDLYRLFENINEIENHRLSNNSVELIMENKEEVCMFHTDPKRLTQVMINLITNALKFTSKGSVKFGYRKQEDGNFYFYVTDTGIGISEENKQRIFGRFVKINSYSQGTGLGLSICEMIVEKLGGTMGVDSVLGEGSTFWFILPSTYNIKQ